MPANLPAAALADPGLEAAFAAVEGLGLGAGLIIAIGAQNAYVLRQGLRRQHVFAVASLCFLIDCSLIALGAGGFAGLLRSVPSLPSLAAWGGAAFLALYSLRAFTAAWRPQALTASEGANGGSLKAALATTLALSLLNPHVYLDTVVLLGGLAALSRHGAPGLRPRRHAGLGPVVLRPRLRRAPAGAVLRQPAGLAPAGRLRRRGHGGAGGRPGRRPAELVVT